MALAFESKVQNLIFQMDQGSGRKVIHAVLFVLFACAVAALYTFTNFQGLNDEGAFDSAQLALNHAEQGELMTRCVRPLSIWKVAAHSPTNDAAVMHHPDLLHPPLWPLMLSGVFRLTGIPTAGQPTTAYVNGWDYVPVVASHVFIALATLLVWLIGRKLFDHRVGMLAAISFLVCDGIWRQSLLGAEWSAALFFVLGAFYAAILAADLPPGIGPQDEQGAAWRWLIPLMISSAFTAAAFLTRYAAGFAAVAIFLFMGASRRSRPWSKAGLYLVLAAVPVIPWVVRNIKVSGSAFGLALYNLLSDTYLFPGDALTRSVTPTMPDALTAIYAVQLKAMANLREFAGQGFGLAGVGILLALFGAMYFHRFVRPATRTLRWSLLPALALTILSAAAFGAESLRAMVFYWPLVMVFGWAFLLVLLDRRQFELRFLPPAVLTLVMFLSAFPLLLQVLPPRTGLPYPPYFHRYIGWTVAMVEPDECLTTDIPWATAWYGNRTSILLPRTLDGFYEIHNQFQPLAMAYFTTVTRDKPWVRGLSDPNAPEYSWYQIFSAGKVPANFPLTNGRFLAGTDQMILR